MTLQRNLFSQQLNHHLKEDEKPAAKNLAQSSMGAMGYTLSKPEEALSSQAAWYVYSAQHISKCTFDNKYFRKMLQAIGGPGTPILLQYKLAHYIQAKIQADDI